ncbi:helix-turn-helix domain-containing protein [Sciscionella sediminilitoris]|uniref:helix-turn-helix domain-containing protein n=1 Tax=Sciscionella sediminilitoris TaxID=1445613 RepID=UPI0004DF1A71|nr:helix-turn-helix domain-containing protein [Sciscionella sp. SE31]
MSAPDITELAASLARLAEQLANQPSEPPAPEPPPMPARTLLTVEEAAHQLGIGRTSMYDLVRKGAIESVRIGNLRRIPTEAITAYVQRLTEQQQQNQAAA